jgi:hypothetical protein
MVQRRHPASSDLPPPTAAVLHSPINFPPDFGSARFVRASPKTNIPPSWPRAGYLGRHSNAMEVFKDKGRSTTTSRQRRIRWRQTKNRPAWLHIRLTSHSCLIRPRCSQRGSGGRGRGGIGMHDLSSCPEGSGNTGRGTAAFFNEFATKPIMSCPVCQGDGSGELT